MPNARQLAQVDPNDSPGIVRRSFGVTIRSINEKERCVDVIASTDTQDAYDEVVDQDWDLKRYSKNPVVLYNHNMGTIFAASPAASLPIGYARDCGVRMGQLEATLCFVDEKANPMAELVWQGFLQKSIRAVSVGFNPRTIKSEKQDDKEFYRLSDNELYEISVCPMGANPDAVGKSKALEQLKQLVEQRTKTAAPAAQQENNMDLEKLVTELRAQIEEKSVALALAKKSIYQHGAAVTDLTAKLEAKTVELTELGTTLKTTETARDAAITRADTAEATLLTKMVDDLVGKKITPAEKEEFLELAKSNKGLFDKMVAKRADMTLLGAPVVGADPTKPTEAKNLENGGTLGAMLEDSESASATPAN